MRGILADKIPQENIKIAEEKLKRFQAFKSELDVQMAVILDLLQAVRLKVGKHILES